MIATIGFQSRRKPARSRTVMAPWLKRGPRGSMGFGAGDWAIEVMICIKPDRESRNSRPAGLAGQEWWPLTANRAHMNTERATSTTTSLRALQRAELLGNATADV